MKRFRRGADSKRKGEDEGSLDGDQAPGAAGPDAPDADEAPAQGGPDAPDGTSGEGGPDVPDGGQAPGGGGQAEATDALAGRAAGLEPSLLAVDLLSLDESDESMEEAALAAEAAAEALAGDDGVPDDSSYEPGGVEQIDVADTGDADDSVEAAAAAAAAEAAALADAAPAPVPEPAAGLPVEGATTDQEESRSTQSATSAGGMTRSDGEAAIWTPDVPDRDLPPRPVPPGTTLQSDPGGVRTRWVADDGAYETILRGRQLINDPRLYRGVAFTEEERRSLGLVGLLPPQVIPLHEQLTRALAQYHAQPTDLAKNVYLSLLKDRNEVLFFRLLTDHLAEMLPVVYTPTVGEAIQHFSHEYRRPRGVFLSVDHPDDIEISLATTALGPDDVDLVVVTDGEAILGIGDWGVGGIAISLGKLHLYTAAGGIDPGRTIGVVLDVGTNRQSLLDDPLYLGNRHPRVDQGTYDAFVDTFVETVIRMFPNALLHWEDLAAGNARRILSRWRNRIFTFNDDIQGTGAVALAAVLSGLRRHHGRLADQRVVIFGPGTAGVGIAEQLRDAMVADGLGHDEATRRFWLVGRRGLLCQSFGDALADFQQPWARPDEEVAGWAPDEDRLLGLSAVVRNVAPTILVGTSGQPGAFTENVVRSMALSCQHPIILPLSNPTDLVEAEPWDIMQWTGGRALVATGSAFDPVTYAWSTHYIGQANNAFVFPGLGLGAILVGATRVTDRMLTAAAQAISAQVDSSIEGGPLLPEIEALHATSAAVALAVAYAAIEDGVARWDIPEPAAESIEAAMWKPEYRPIRAV